MLLSHVHQDHSLGVIRHIALREMTGAKPSRIWVPEESRDALIDAVAAFHRMERRDPYVTAALADASDSAQWTDRAEQQRRILTIEGTSMAAPVVAGAVALMLQKKATLSLQDATDALTQAAKRDAHTGALPWSPTYGVGKLDIAAAIAKV